MQKETVNWKQHCKLWSLSYMPT